MTGADGSAGTFLLGVVRRVALCTSDRVVEIVARCECAENNHDCDTCKSFHNLGPSSRMMRNGTNAPREHTYQFSAGAHIAPQ